VCGPLRQHNRALREAKRETGRANRIQRASPPEDATARRTKFYQARAPRSTKVEGKISA